MHVACTSSSDKFTVMFSFTLNLPFYTETGSPSFCVYCITHPLIKLVRKQFEWCLTQAFSNRAWAVVKSFEWLTNFCALTRLVMDKESCLNSVSLYFSFVSQGQTRVKHLIAWMDNAVLPLFHRSGFFSWLLGCALFLHCYADAGVTQQCCSSCLPVCCPFCMLKSHELLHRTAST